MNEQYLEFCAGTMFLCKMNIYDSFTLDKIHIVYHQLNTVDTLDIHWYNQFYKVPYELVKSDYNNRKKKRHPNNLSYSSSTKKDGLRDCMIEHAMERLFGYMCKRGKFRII